MAVGALAPTLEDIGALLPLAPPTETPDASQTDWRLLLPGLDVTTGFTPNDPDTLLPLPIHPGKDLPAPIIAPDINVEREADWHHTNHPGAQLTGTSDGNAVRQASVLWVLYRSHHIETDGYHLYFNGPIIAPDRSGRFGHTLLQVAGALSPWALDFSHDEASIVPLRPRDRVAMWERGDIRASSMGTVRTFWTEHLLDQFNIHADAIDRKVVEEFRQAESRFLRIAKMSALVKHLARIAADPHRERYQEAFEKHLLRPQTSIEPEKFITAELLTSHGDHGALLNKMQEATAKYVRQQDGITKSRHEDLELEELAPTGS